MASLSTGLSTTAAGVASLSTQVTSGTTGAVRYGSGPSNQGSGDTTPLDMYLAPGKGEGVVTLHNVNAGAVTASSTDAINGSQLHALGSNITSALGGGASYANGVFKGPAYTVQGQSYASVGGAVGALDNAVSGLSNHTSNLYQIVGKLDQQIAQNRRIAAGGVASAIAISQVRYNDQPGKVTLGLGTGFYDGGYAFAVGVGATSEDGHWRINSSGSFAPQVSKFGFGAGASYSW